MAVFERFNPLSAVTGFQTIFPVFGCFLVHFVFQSPFCCDGVPDKNGRQRSSKYNERFNPLSAVTGFQTLF